MDFSQLTIIIPTYNRQRFIFRQFLHWKDTNVNLIFLDGSESPINQQLKNMILQNNRFFYYNSQGSVGQRLLIASQLISTPYAITCNDDDYLFKSGIYSSIELLNSRNDLVACRGQTIRAYISSDKKILSFTQVFNKLENFNANQNNVLERLEYAFLNYNAATLFSVLRTWVWKESWVKGYNQNFSSTNVSEFFQSISVYIHGKLTCLNSPYILETNENGAIDTISDNRSLLFSDWVNSEKYILERINFIDSLANELTTKHYISIEQSKKFILGLMNIYVNLYKSHSLVKYFFKKKFTVKLVNTIISVFKRKPLIIIYDKVRSRVILNRISKNSLLLSDFLDDLFNLNNKTIYSLYWLVLILFVFYWWRLRNFIYYLMNKFHKFL
jgi:glycosyltransferase domain-containing protein